MKIAIVGSARFSSEQFIEDTIKSMGVYDSITEIYCRDDDCGFDNAVKAFAAHRRIKCYPIKAEWMYWQSRCGATTKNPAGRIRDETIAKYVDAAVIIWNGKPKSDVKTFIDIMHDANKKIYLNQISEDLYVKEYEPANYRK